MRFLSLLLSLAVVAIGVYLYMKSTAQSPEPVQEAGRQAIEEAEKAGKAMEDSLRKQQERMQAIEK